MKQFERLFGRPFVHAVCVICCTAALLYGIPGQAQTTTANPLLVPGMVDRVADKADDTSGESADKAGRGAASGETAGGSQSGDGAVAKATVEAAAVTAAGQPLVVKLEMPEPPPPPPPAPEPKPVTIDDVQIPVDELKIMLKPLSTDELKLEQDAWFGALHAKSKEVAEQELLTARLNKQAQQVTTQLDALEALSRPAPEQASKDEQAPSREAVLAGVQEALQALGSGANLDDDPKSLEKALNQMGEDLSTQKEVIVERASQLRDQRTGLVDRLTAVFDAINTTAGLKDDGTDNDIVVPYRMYVKSITGINIDISDAETSKKAVQKWLLSKEGGIRWLKNIGLFLGILFGFWILSYILSFFVSRSLGMMRNPSRLLRSFMSGLVRKLTMIIGFVFALSALEVNISPILAALGAIGFILAFALQGTISNFASGLLILFYRPFDMGDAITAGGVSGTVKSMTLVSTLITTPDNQNIIVPNNAVWSGSITNASNSANRRVDMSFTVPKESDIDRVQRVLEDIVARNPKVLRDPPAIVRLDSLVEGNAVFVVRPWVKNADYSDVYWEITREVKLRLDEAEPAAPVDPVSAD
ncbi:MAG TPA: mechanosensitive ion channel [Thiolinea sp.]|nr:mechanosensitive ion channel [Thiolinea sp.]